MKITERNLQEIGKSLLVSLPKEWTQTLKLKKGSKIKIAQSEQGNLLISPEFTKKEEKLETTIDFNEKFYRNFFRDYFRGSEKITINIASSISERERKEIYRFLDKFMNIQIVEESKLKIVLKSFRIEEISIEECLRRMQYISADMIDEVIEPTSKAKLEELERSLTKFYFMLVMQIRRFLDEGKFTENNQISLTRALDSRMIGEKIERISDITKDFSPLSPELKHVLTNLNKVYEKAFLVFINQNYEKSLELSIKSELSELTTLENKAISSKNTKLLSQVINLKRIAEYIKEIYSLTR